MAADAAWARWMQELACCTSSLYGAGPANILSELIFSYEELGPQVLLSDGLMIDNRQGSDPSQDQILGDLVGERFEGDEKDIRRA